MKLAMDSRIRMMLSFVKRIKSYRAVALLSICLWFSAPALAAPAIVNSGAAHMCYPTGASGGTSGSSIVTTGADFIIRAITYNLGATQPAVSDSAGNTYSTTTVFNGPNTSTFFAYVYNPTTSATHTFTVSGTTIYASDCVIAWSGIQASGLDQLSGNNSCASLVASCAAGSITPTAANVIFAATGQGASGDTVGIDSSMTISDQIQFTPGNNFGDALAYIIQSSPSIISPTWSSTVAGANDFSPTIVDFKSGSAPVNAGGVTKKTKLSKLSVTR